MALTVNEDMMREDPEGKRRWQEIQRLGEWIAKGKSDLRLLCHCRWTRWRAEGCRKCHCEPMAESIEREAHRQQRSTESTKGERTQTEAEEAAEAHDMTEGTDGQRDEWTDEHRDASEEEKTQEDRDSGGGGYPPTAEETREARKKHKNDRQRTEEQTEATTRAQAESEADTAPAAGSTQETQETPIISSAISPPEFSHEQHHLGEAPHRAHHVAYRLTPRGLRNWTHKTHCRGSPRELFLFGENDTDHGSMTPASSTQAVIRGEPNACGIRTCSERRRGYRDEHLSVNGPKITADIDNAIRRAIEGGYTCVVQPGDGLGTGAAGLPHDAPLTFAFLGRELTRLRHALEASTSCGGWQATPTRKRTREEETKAEQQTNARTNQQWADTFLDGINEQSKLAREGGGDIGTTRHSKDRQNKYGDENRKKKDRQIE